MLEALKLKKSVKRCKKHIEYLEKKRSRSQAALVEAILTHTSPSDTDVEFFNKFTRLIDEERNAMHEYQRQLANLK